MDFYWLSSLWLGPGVLVGCGDLIVVGGLGGGGDVILALMILEAYNIGLGSVVVVSFNRCKTRARSFRDIRVEGALVRVPPGYFSSRRIFEDKLYLLEPGLGDRTYIICIGDGFDNVILGLEWIYRRYRPGILLHSDIGGDSLLMGYEEKLGSYKTDTVARASLAYLARRYGLKSYLAAGCVGCEGGGDELNHWELASNIEYAYRNGALVKAMVLPRQTLELGYRVLRYADSGMLPMLLAALRGVKTAEIHSAYLHGKYRIMPWYKCTFILDNEKYCFLSPLCRSLMEKGEFPALKPGKKAAHRVTRVPDPASILDRICKEYSSRKNTL